MEPVINCTYIGSQKIKIYVAFDKNSSTISAETYAARTIEVKVLSYSEKKCD